MFLLRLVIRIGGLRTLESVTDENRWYGKLCLLRINALIGSVIYVIENLIYIKQLLY